MAQHKAAMERISREDEEGDKNQMQLSSQQSDSDDIEECHGRTREQITPRPNDNNSNTTDHSAILSFLRKHGAVIMMPIIPILWCILLLIVMDHEMIMSAYAMPLLGICSASLANAVPVGGGIVFVPVLSLFGVQLHLGTSFAVATMTFGNGVFGFLSWLRKDPASIAWRIVPYAVLPAWIGASLGTFRPFLTNEQCRHLFAGFCIIVAIVVGRGIYQNKGVNDTKGRPFSIVDNTDETRGSDQNLRQKVLASLFSFLAGLVLVPHIGIGNAMTTFLVCSFVWRLPAKSSVVTGILVGGWTSIVPFSIHLLYFGDVPIALWVMGLPGVYLGARVAPLVHEKIGITNVLIAFVIFLIVTAALMVWA